MTDSTVFTESLCTNKALILMEWGRVGVEKGTGDGGLKWKAQARASSSGASSEFSVLLEDEVINNFSLPLLS